MRVAIAKLPLQYGSTFSMTVPPNSTNINAACQGWSEIQAAYRFFDNRRVEPQKLLEPHRRVLSHLYVG